MTRRHILQERVHLVAFVVIAVLAAISLVSQRNADWYSGDDFYSLQVVWYIIGGVVFVIAGLVDLRMVERLSLTFYGLCIFGLVLTAFVGTEVNNSQRWLRFLGLNIQFSEITKLGTVLALAHWYHARKERAPGAPASHEGTYRLRDLTQPIALVALPFVLVLTQPDLGTALVIALVAVTVTVYEGLDRRTIAMVIFGALILVPVAWQLGGIKEYQKDRVRLWVNPDWFKFDADTGVVAKGRHLQSEQAIWAIGSGEFWGQGSKLGAQSRLKYLPEMHTDMIFATFAEERGFVGCTVLLILFWFLVYWGLRTAQDARDRFCALVAVGAIAIVAWQVFINIGMVAGLLPIVGLPLPFLSYGGSSTVTLMACLGLLLNVALHRGRL